MPRHYQIIPLALALLVGAVPAAQAKLYDPNAVTRVPSHVQDLRSPDTRDLANGYRPTGGQDMRSPDTRDHANGYMPTGVQDLRSPDTRDAATAPPATSESPDRTGAWALLVVVVVTSGVVLGFVARTRRTRVPV